MLLLWQRDVKRFSIIMSTFEISINSNETLLKAFDVLHDASCEESNITYDPERRTLDIIFGREFFEDQSKINVRRVWIIFYKAEYPIIKSHLYLEGLTYFKMHSSDRTLKTHTFNECRIGQDKYFLHFCEVLKIVIGLQSPFSGYLSDGEFVQGKKGTTIEFLKMPILSYQKY